MKERPILFSGPMVRAILEGRKTQTRRCVKVSYIYDYASPKGQKQQRTGVRGYIGQHINRKGQSDSLHVVDQDCDILSHDEFMEFCPQGQPGERLWVRETWTHCDFCGQLNYRASTTTAYGLACKDCDRTLETWKPSIHMFREDSRITLEVTEVRVQRLKDISEDDARAEGVVAEPVPGFEHTANASAFATLWDSINGKRPGCDWRSNPWVWVVSFKRVTP